MDWQTLAILTWCCCAFLGALAAEGRQATEWGLGLGLLFGPLGVLTACFIDRRSQCPRCGGRINSTANKHYPICQHCGGELEYETEEEPVKESKWPLS